MVKKFADLLMNEAIQEVRTWEDIYALSAKHGIAHSGQNKDKRGCPFKKIKKELGIKHSLPSRKYYSVGVLEKHLSCFDQDDLPHIERYALSSLKNYKFKITTDANIRTILAFYKWLAPSTLLKVNQEVLLQYLEGFDRSIKWRYPQHFYALRMFYRWAKSEKLIDRDLFKGLASPSIKLKCQLCKKLKMFRVEGEVCNTCLSLKKNANKISKLSEDIEIKTVYNKYLLDLYFKYISRYAITNGHILVTKKLKIFLKTKSIQTLKRWPDIKEVSAEFERFVGYKLNRSCPFIKIGKMLQELNVLPVAQEDYAIRYEKAVNRLPDSFRAVAKDYFGELKKRKVTLSTCTSYANYFNRFKKWFEENYGSDNILNASETILSNYFVEVYSGNRAIPIILFFKKFYSWGKKKKYILINPLEKWRPPKLDVSLLICSDDQIKKIIKYIKCPASDPERAMILALIIFWGLTGPELRCSTVEHEKGLIKIRPYRKKLSYGRKYCNKKPVLELPDRPLWIKGLQERFINDWENKYKQVKMSFPHQLLLFTKNLKSNRPITESGLRIRVYKATVEATGEEIPPSVLRRTCGHIYSKTGEASILRDLGWSKSYAPQFLWRQREYFRGRK